MNAKTLTLASALLIGASFANAQVKEFKVGNAGGMKVSQVFTVDSDAQFENFTGQTHNVEGSIKFDPAKKGGSGRIDVDLTSLDTGIALRNEHLRSEMWFNTEKYPEATFEATGVHHKRGDLYEVTGKLTLHGVTKTIKANCVVRYIKESEATRKAMFKGDVLQVKTDFAIRLADFGVMIPDMAKGKVAETIQAHLNVFAQSG